MSLINQNLRDTSNMFKRKQVAAMEVLDEYLNVALKGSCITFCNELSFEMAKELDNNNKKAMSPIAALPFSLKDNICTKGILTTCNSRSLKTNIPDITAGVVDNLTSFSAILTAKSCMREFSVGRIEDSAFELRNYLVWAGTNANTNIGAFSIGTDIGVSENFFGTWVLKLADIDTSGIISGAPSLEKMTLMTRRADDLGFLLPFLYGESKPLESHRIDPDNYKILVYNDLNSAGYLRDFFENIGFQAASSNCAFLNQADLIYEVILCTEFYTHLQKVGQPNNEQNKRQNDEYIRNRSENIGFEARLNIVKGSYLLSEKNEEKTLSILNSKSGLINRITACLDTYDFIASPAFYDDRLSKASAIAGLAELTVPFGDVIPFKLITKPEKQRLLPDIALYLEEWL